MKVSYHFGHGSILVLFYYEFNIYPFVSKYSSHLIEWKKVDNLHESNKNFINIQKSITS